MSDRIEMRPEDEWKFAIKRKVVQVTTYLDGNTTCILALCDDGSLWISQPVPGDVIWLPLSSPPGKAK